MFKGENLNDALNLLFPADNWVNLRLPGHAVKVTAVFFQQRRTLTLMTPRPLFRQRSVTFGVLTVNSVHDFILQRVRVHAHQLKNLHGRAFGFFEQAQKDMLRADIVVT